MLHMTFSASHGCGKFVKQVYNLQQSCKFAYNKYMYKAAYLITGKFATLL